MLDEEISQRVLQQFLSLWVNPEVERRQKAGTLPAGFTLVRAQVLMFADGRQHVVRLNDEVRAILKVKWSRPARSGQPVEESDVKEIMNIKLTDTDDPDAGHITGFLLRGEWVLAFDFRYNKGKAKKLVHAAKQFMEAGKQNMASGLYRPFVDNMFSAIELLATAQLFIIPDPKYTQKPTHRATSRKYNAFISLGNLKPEYAEALNKLSGLRDRARYLRGDFPLAEEEGKKFLDTAGKMLEATEKMVS